MTRIFKILIVNCLLTRLNFRKLDEQCGKEQKLVLTLVVGVFAFGMSGFSESDPTLQSTYCMNLQHDAFAFHNNNGSDIDDAWAQSIEVYDNCERKRGR